MILNPDHADMQAVYDAIPNNSELSQQESKINLFDIPYFIVAGVLLVMFALMLVGKLEPITVYGAVRMASQMVMDPIER